MSKSKKTSEKEPGKLVDFAVIRESWHVYELEDDTIIRTKNTLMTILDAGPAEHTEVGALDMRKLGFGLKLLNVVHSPKHLRGPKGKAWPLSKLEKSIVQRNLKFRQIKDAGNCEYETEKWKIIISTRLRQVDKTSKFGVNGMPAYIVRTESMILLAEKPEEKAEKTET